MRIHASMLLALASLLPGISPLAAEENAEQRRAMAELEKLGATFVVDENLSGGAVVAVDLDHSDVHGDTLKRLKLFPHLHSLKWREVWPIGEEGMAIVGALTQLRNLDIGAWRIEDGWLKHLEGLTNLESLTLYGGETFTDEGLRHLRRLSALRSLNLHFAGNITDKGLAPLRGLTNLRHLDLSGSKISDAGLVCLKPFPHLETLDLSGTNVGDKGLVHLKDLVRLHSLNLRSTKITDKGLKHLQRLTALRKLDLDAQDIFGDTLDDLKFLNNLRSLKLGGNVVRGETLAKLKELKSLRELAFSTARFDDDDWKYIGQLTNLESLRIWIARRVTDKGLKHLWQLTHLRELELCHIEAMTDKSMAGLASMTNLRRLRLSQLPNISDTGIRHLRRLSNLESLDLQEVPINRESWRIITQLKHLRSLCLSISTANNKTLEDLKGMKSLRELRISGMDINDASVMCLWDLPVLQVIDLSVTSVTNRGLGHLKSLPNLRTLAVESSKVTDEGVAMFRAAKPGVKVIQYVVRQSFYTPPAEITESKPSPSQVLLPLVHILADSDDPVVQLDVLRGMHEALQGRRSVTAPEGWSAVHRKLADSKNGEIREKVLQLSVLFGDPQAIAALRQMAADPKADAAVRRNALQTLIEKRPPELLSLLRTLIGDRAVRSTALRGLASYSDPQTPPLILEQYASFTDAEKTDAIATLASRPAYALALLDAMAKGRVPRRDLSAFTVRQLLAFKDKNLTEQLTKVWGSIRPPSAEKATLMAKYKAMVPADALKKADRKHGRLLFSRTCASCHTLFGEGGKIGPDLTGSQRTNPEYLLTKLLDPSAVVARDYQMTILTTKSGRTLSGLVKEENDKTLTLQTQNEVVRVDKTNIEDRQRSPQSMMPDGLLAMLSPAEIRDLIAYVSGAGQVPLPPEPRKKPLD